MSGSTKISPVSAAETGCARQVVEEAQRHDCAVSGVQATGERALFRNPSAFLIFFGATTAALCGLFLYQRYFIYEKLRIIYEEEPEPVMVTL